MMQQVWVEMDYLLDICRVAKGGHIEHLRDMQKKKKKLGESFSLHL
jgi:hypothetical protein